MSSFLERLEFGIDSLLFSVRGHDAALFNKTQAFKDHPEPTITVTAPEHGASGSELNDDNSFLGENRFP